MKQKLNLKRTPHDRPDFQGMYDQISRLERLVFNQHLREGESRAGWLKEILDFQAEDGSFALVDSPRIESDARVEFCYEPSYLCSALLMEEVMRHKEPPEALVDALRRALKFCCGRGLQGHGYESEEGEERAMGWFLRCGLEDFLLFYPDLVPEFTRLAEELLNNWTRLFVYGTLMGTGKRNQALNQAVYYDKGSIKGYALYDLGDYPAARQGGHGAVRGELYHVHRRSLRHIDRIEGEGTLFRRYPVYVEEERYLLRAEAYLYVDELHGAPQTGEDKQPYGPRSEDLVWYAAYGTNIDEKRFSYYIRGGTYPVTGRHHEGCRDKTMPISNMPVTLCYNRYFARRSSQWDHRGVAFLDLNQPGITLGRAYLITREQYRDIQQQEGPGWYHHDALLGCHHGIQVRTLTHSSRISPENEPSGKYLQVMEKAQSSLNWRQGMVL